MKTLLSTSYIDMATNSNDVLIALIITSGVVLCVFNHFCFDVCIKTSEARSSRAN